MSGTSITISSGERIYLPDEVRLGSERSRSYGSPDSTESHSGHSSADSWVRIASANQAAYDLETDQPPRSRHRSDSRRHVAEAPEVPSRRSSVAPREAHYRPPPQRTRSSRQPPRGRTPSDESTSTLASHDDHLYGPGYGPQRHRYAAPGHGPAYPPSQAGGYDPFTPQDLVTVPRDSFGYPIHNAYGAGAPNPFAPQAQMPPQAAAGAYHPQDHYARPAPHSRASMYAAPGYGPDMYAMQHMMHPGYAMYPPVGYPAPPSSQPASPPPAEAQNAKEFEALKEIIKKHEEERLAWEKALIAKAEAEAAAKAAEIARAEEEKKRKADIADASAKAKEAAEKKAADDAKKAADEAEKKLAEAKKAQEEAEKKSKDLEEEKKKNAPPPDASKPPIKFKDAADRKFNFPWAVCKTWKGMEGLIKQAFLHIDVLGEHVQQGHYDLTGPDGEIILPQVWESTVEPGWEIAMVMWPMAEVAPPMMAGAADVFQGATLEELLTRPQGGKKGKGKIKASGKSKKQAVTTVMMPGGHVIPPPPLHPNAAMAPMDILADLMPGGLVIDDKVKVKGSSSKKKASPLVRWMTGAPPPKRRS